MPAIFDTTDDGLKRITGILPANTQYVTTMFWVYFNAWPTSGQTRTFYMISNSASRDTESIAIIQDDTGSIKLKVGTTSYGGQIFPPGWHSIGLRRRATSNFLDMDVDNDTTVVSSATVTFSGWTFDEVYLGHDPRIPTGGVTHQVAYFREWAAFMTYVVEWKSPNPVQTTGLDTDTPLHDDLLDNTVNDHDWTALGTQTFTSVPNSREGSMGGWWSMSPFSTPNFANVHHEGILTVAQCDTLGDSAQREIAAVSVACWGYTFFGHDGGIPPANDTYGDVTYKIHLRYATLPTTTDATLEAEVSDPIVDPANGQSDVTIAGPRNVWHIPWRFALTWKCSTYDADTDTYAADGYAKVYLNDGIILQVVDKVIPRRPDIHGLEYTVGILADCDRVWARTVPDVPATNSEGAFTGGTPTNLLYFDDFDGGSYSNWTLVEMYKPGGGSTPATNVYSNCGGDNGYGLSIYATDPTGASGGTYQPWSGIYRFEKFPPIDFTEGDDPEDPGDPPPVIPGDPTGLYYTNPPTPGIPGLTHDTYIDRTVTPSSTIERKIPDPTIRTALFGE